MWFLAMLYTQGSNRFELSDIGEDVAMTRRPREEFAQLYFISGSFLLTKRECKPRP